MARRIVEAEAPDVDEMEGAERHVVERTGKRPIVFTGELICEVYGASGQTKRWHDISVYKTPSFKFVVVIKYTSTWEGEVDFTTVEVVDTPEDVATVLESHDPTKCVQGFPPLSEQHLLKQQMLLRDITLRFKDLVTQLLSKMPGIEEVVA